MGVRTSTQKKRGGPHLALQSREYPYVDTQSTISKKMKGRHSIKGQRRCTVIYSTHGSRILSLTWQSVKFVSSLATGQSQTVTGEAPIHFESRLEVSADQVIRHWILHRAKKGRNHYIFVSNITCNYCSNCQMLTVHTTLPVRRKKP